MDYWRIVGSTAVVLAMTLAGCGQTNTSATSAAAVSSPAGPEPAPVVTDTALTVPDPCTAFTLTDLNVDAGLTVGAGTSDPQATNEQQTVCVWTSEVPAAELRLLISVAEGAFAAGETADAPTQPADLQLVNDAYAAPGVVGASMGSFSGELFVRLSVTGDPEALSAEELQALAQTAILNI